MTRKSLNWNPLVPNWQSQILNKDVTEFKRFNFDSQGTFKGGATHESRINRLTEQLEESTQETTFLASSAKDLNNASIDDGATLTEDNFKEPASAKNK